MLLNTHTHARACARAHTHTCCAREFSGSLVVRIFSFPSCDLGLVPGLRTKIPQAHGVGKTNKQLR